jgi:hypothetical protein
MSTSGAICRKRARHCLASVWPPDCFQHQIVAAPVVYCTFTKLAALATQNLSSTKMKDVLNNWADSNPTYTNQTFSVLPQASIGDLNNETLAFST